MSLRCKIPTRFLVDIEQWLLSLTYMTYSFDKSSVINTSLHKTVYFGDLHADPRGFITALL